MDKTPGLRGLERCQEYKENVIRNFMRGLDRGTLYFVREKSPTTLNEAIEHAAEADLENSTWNENKYSLFNKSEFSIRDF